MRLLLSLLFALPLFSNPLPVDEKVISGTLDNGLTYFIRENNYPKGQAQLRLIVKVGSAYENEDEQGIAHFVEHLVFRGSDHFRDWEIIDYLESIGAEFGPDTNAYTSFEETVYMLNIPLEQEESLEKALLILSDFAGRAHLKSEMIEAERGVVLDELRMRDSAEARAAMKEYSWLCEGSSYENRFPVGKPEIVRNSSHETVRNFYKRHYRPDNIAVVAVGDFESRKVEEFVHRFFSSLSDHSVDALQPLKKAPLSYERKVFTHVAEETSFTNLSMIHLDHPKCIESDEALLEARLSSYIFSFLNLRFAELVQSAKSPIIFGGAFSGRDNIEGGYETSRILVVPYEGHEKEALQALWRLFLALFQYGVSEEEFNQIVQSEKEALLKLKRSFDRIDHSYFVDILTNHVLEGQLIYDFYDIIQREMVLLDSLNCADVNDFLTQYSWGTPWHFSLLSNKDLFEGFDLTSSLEEWSACIVAHEGKKRGSLSTQIGEAGRILSRTEDQGIKVYTLSNGMEVYTQKSDIQKGEILFKALALEGTAALEKERWDEARMLPFYLQKVGFGGLDAYEIQLLMNEKNISAAPFLDLNMRGIKGNCPRENLELFCQLFHLFFTDKQKSDEGFIAMRRLYNEIRRYFEANPEIAFEEHVIKTATEDHPYFRTIDAEGLTNERCFELTEEFFSNPADFALFIVGDFDDAALEALLENYIASIPRKEETLLCSTIFEFPQGEYREVFRKGSEEKAVTKLMAFVDLPKAGNQFAQDVLRKTIETRLFNALRRGLGDSYGVHVTFNHLHYPILNPSLIKIDFTHSPGEREKAIACVEEELAKFKSEPLLESEVKVAKEIIRANLQEARQGNRYLLSNLEEYFLYGSLSNPESDLDGLTAEIISSYAQEIFTQINWKIFTLQAE